MQKSFINVLKKYYNAVKDDPVTVEILNERINGCAEEVVQLLISKCKLQIKDKFPQQLSKLLQIAKQFDEDTLKELTADVKKNLKYKRGERIEIF